LIVIWGGLLFSVLYLFNDKLAAIINIPVELIIIGGITSLFSGFYTVLQAYLQAAKKSVLLSRTSFLFAFLILSIAILLMSLLAEQRYLGMVYSKIAVTLIFSLISIVLLKKVIIQRFLLKHVKYALLFGLPIVIHEISGLMLNSADQFMINYIIGSSETGLYSFAYKISMLFTILTLGLNQAWLPQFYEKLKTKSYGEIKITMQKYSIGITVVAVLMVLFSPLLVRIMASKQYYDSIVLIPIIIIGFMFHYLYVVYVNYVFYEKRTFFIALFTVISALINIGLNYVLLPLFGYEIAAWTTLISYLVLFVLHYVNVKFILKINNIIPLRYSALPVFIGIFLIIVYIQL
jgi:O-antigen/teichoic acid export membrane protein